MNDNQDDGGQAFPGILWDEWEGKQKIIGSSKGMTLWDFYAAHALQGMVVRCGRPDKSLMPQLIYDISQIADAMIDGRNRRFKS